MISVCHVITDTNFGGAGRVLLNYCKTYNRADFRLFVVLPRGSELLEPLRQTDVELIEADGLYDRSYSREDVRNLAVIFRQHAFQLIHAHGALSARIAARKCGIPVIYTRHSVFDPPRRATRFPIRQIQGFCNNRYADGIIAVSPAAKEILAATGSDPRKIRVIYNGVPPLEPGPGVYRARFSWGPKDLVLGIVARLEEVKGHHDLLKALALLPEPIKLLIAGTGAQEAALKAQCRALQLEKRVVFCGFVQDVAGLMNSLDVQINASYGTEATSMALLEGFSLGIPAVVTDFGGNPYVVESGVNGLVVPKRDPHAMARAIERLWEEPGLRKQLGAGARAAYAQRFRAEMMTRQTEEYYREVLKQHG